MKTLNYYVLICFAAIQHTEPQLCIPDQQYEVKNVLVNSTVFGTNTLLQLNMGECGHYCFDIVGKDMIYYKNHSCVCFEITKEHAVYSYDRNSQGALVPIDVVMPVYNGSKLFICKSINVFENLTY